MLLDGLEVARWDEAASASLYSRRLIFSASVLVLYDMALTFDHEVKVVWKRNFHFIDCMYLANRYGQLWNVLLNVALFKHYDDQSCRALSILAQIATMIPNISWAAFSGFRTYALLDGNVLVGWIVFAMSATFVAPNIYSLKGLEGISLPPPLNCVSWNPSRNMTLLIVPKALFMLSEVFVITLTWKKTVNDYRRSRRLQQGTCRLQSVLFENGMMCFVVPFILNALMLATALTEWMDSHTHVYLSDIFGPFRNSITTILLSRFLLQLGELRNGGNTTWDTSQGVMTTQISYDPSDVPSAVTPLDWGRWA